MRILIRTTGVRWLASVLIALALVCAPALTKGSPPVRATAAPHATVTPLALYNSHLNREVFGFVNWQNLGSSTVGYPSWNLKLLSTVAYFGLNVNSGDGNLVTNNGAWTTFHSSTMTNFVNAAHANGVRVIVSIDVHDFSTNPYSQICEALDTAHTPNTISQIVALVKNAGIDGINVDYEGTVATCEGGFTNRVELVNFVHSLRDAMPAGSYLAIDTFSGAAEDDQEFFDIAGLEPYVDSFFVMAYDMDQANYNQPPLNCATYCFNPISPLNTYRFNVTSSMAQYTAIVPPSKVILGQPYYGRRGCVANLNGGHQTLTRSIATPTYLFAASVPSQPGVSKFRAGRDSGDGVSRWYAWYDSDFGCDREQYFDDTTSLAAKYSLVLQDKLRGVGLFTLDYGGSSAQLWSLLNTYFSCPVDVNVAATQSSTEFNLGLDAGSCSVTQFDVQQFDTTLEQGWFDVGPAGATGGTGNINVEGYAGHTYQFRARAHSSAGTVGAWSPIVATQVPSTATASHPFSGVYTLDGWGGIHGADSPPLGTTAYWQGWNIARAAHAPPGASSPQSGAVLDGYGGLHSYGAPLTFTTSAYWNGWDIARDFAFLPDGSGGFVLDGYGGLHAFHVNGGTAALQAVGFTYWPGWDIARKVVIFADGTGGYVLDGYGGVHPFGINGPAPVTAGSVALSAYWSGWNIARDIVLEPGNGGHSGYVLDGYGGLHPFHVTSDGSVMPAAITPGAYWHGWDIARGVVLLPGSATAGYTLDGYGGLHPFGGAPAIKRFAYWNGWDIARAVWDG